MVVHKGAQNIDIGEIRLVELLVRLSQLVHGLLTAINIPDREEHWVVEQSCHVVLIIGDKANISIETLSHLEDSAGISILFPEGLGDVWDGVDADTIEVEFRDGRFDPLLQVVAHEFVVLVQIRKASEPAVLDRPLVIPVDITLWMVVFSLIEWIDVREVGVGVVARVVGDDIQHDPDVTVMASLDQIMEIFFAAEVLIDFLPVKRTISVVVGLSIVRDR